MDTSAAFDDSVPEPTWLVALAHDHINAVRQLTPDEATRFLGAIEHLIEYDRSRDHIELVRRNYSDLTAELDKASNFTPPPAEARAQRRELDTEINRRFLNLLASYRFYLDGSETRLKRRYGADSREANDFKRACSAAYDSSFAFRFISRFRNYAQHIGVPVGFVLLSSTFDRDSQEHTHSVSLGFDAAKLRQEGKEFWRSLYEELESRLPTLDVIPIVKEMTELVQVIDSKCQSLERDALQRSADEIAVIGHEAIAKGATPAAGRPGARDGSRMTFTLAQVPLTVIDWLGCSWARVSWE